VEVEVAEEVHQSLEAGAVEEAVVMERAFCC